jgi:hypothetical protein
MENQMAIVMVMEMEMEMDKDKDTITSQAHFQMHFKVHRMA